MKRQIKLLSIIVLMSLFGCVPMEDGPVRPISEQDFNITFHKVNSQNISDYTNLLQSTINISNEVQFSTFGEIGNNGYAGSFNKIYLYDKGSNTESIILLDDNKSPAFMYNVDLVSGEKLESLTEFQPIENNKFYLRFYHYDWINRIGTLLFETIITISGESFESTPTFETENLDFGSGKSSVAKQKENKSFGMPLTRLESYLKGPLKIRLKKSDDLIGDWIIDLEKFRNSDVVEFLNIAEWTGGIGAVVGAGIILIGSTASVPLLIGGAGLAAASRATEFFISNQFEDFINNQLNGFENFVDGSFETVENTIQIVDGYTSDLESWINDNISENDLESLLESLEEKELISDNELLDDLPSSAGVLQFGLSWNTPGTDIDLYVTDPLGSTIYFESPNSASGGYLDRDDTDGFGPENIYWQNNIPEGVYRVNVNYFGCDNEMACPTTSYTIKISNGLGFINSFSGTLSTVGQTNQVVDFGYSLNDF
tara:strand:+ start:2867 stop:4318 length:1452 start_codon:yes stop_codon:yes gene_type:complete